MKTGLYRETKFCLLLFLCLRPITFFTNYICIYRKSIYLCNVTFKKR